MVNTVHINIYVFVRWVPRQNKYFKINKILKYDDKKTQNSECDIIITNAKGVVTPSNYN